MLILLKFSSLQEVVNFMGMILTLTARLYTKVLQKAESKNSLAREKIGILGRKLYALII